MKILSILIAMITALLLGGCASTGSNSTGQLLSAAGFVTKSPQNGKQRELYDALPSYKVHRGTYKGSVIYAYKDEKGGFAYVGNESAYQRYQQLAVQRRIASDYRAAEMDRQMAGGWYGAYGPYVGYRHAVIIR